jgi:hypothetical protein
MKKPSTKHYSSEEWVDFVMHHTPQSQQANMQRHLDSGCKPCAELLSLWTRVGQFAARESALQPPSSAVHHVRAAFSSMANAQKAGREPLIPRLSFDSLWQPAMAGIRSSSTGPRKLLYTSKDITIEMHIESESKSDRMNLTGQISLGSQQGQSMDPVPVVISSEEGKLASATTNGFGEFHLSCVPEADLQISFELAGGLIVVIPLSDPAERGYRRV